MRLIIALVVAAFLAIGTLYFSNFASMIYLDMLLKLNRSDNMLLTLSLISLSVLIIGSSAILRRRRKDKHSQHIL